MSDSQIASTTFVIHDRIFWIYFIITLFFIIIGVGAILSSNDPYMIVIAIFWLLSNVALMILVYHASVNCMDPEIDHQCYTVGTNSRVWLFINILFIILLIISTLWAGELRNQDSGPLRTMSGVLILLGGLILCGLASGVLIAGNDCFALSRTFIAPFWVAIGYILIWFGLTLYVVLTST